MANLLRPPPGSAACGVGDSSGVHTITSGADNGDILRLPAYKLCTLSQVGHFSDDLVIKPFNEKLEPKKSKMLLLDNYIMCRNPERVPPVWLSLAGAGLPPCS